MRRKSAPNRAGPSRRGYGRRIRTVPLHLPSFSPGALPSKGRGAGRVRSAAPRYTTNRRPHDEYCAGNRLLRLRLTVLLFGRGSLGRARAPARRGLRVATLRVTPRARAAARRLAPPWRIPASDGRAAPACSPAIRRGDVPPSYEAPLALGPRGGRVCARPRPFDALRTALFQAYSSMTAMSGTRTCSRTS